MQLMVTTDPKTQITEADGVRAKELGQWVTNRIVRRFELTGKPIPKYVADWLTVAGSSAPPGNVAAPSDVVWWLNQTTAKPDWPEEE